MAISHVCTQCGFDTAAVRAEHDRQYDLWIVRCPRCLTSAARNPNAISRTWRRMLRLDMALSIIVVQVLVAASPVHG